MNSSGLIAGETIQTETFMPVAILRFRQGKIPLETVAQISSRIPAVIAEALDVPDDPKARLAAADIETWVQFTTALDTNVKDLRVLVFAHDYPARSANLEERKEKILAGLKEILCEFDNDVKGWVWVHLNKTAFGGLENAH